MIKRTLLFWGLVLYCFCCSAQPLSLSGGMRISRTTLIRKAVYPIDAPLDTSKPVILIEGNNLVVDFNNAELKGSNDKQYPDEFTGIAVLVRNCRNVILKNLKAKGYKVALVARNVEGLVLDNCDFSYNYRQHLNSTQEKEDISDWMSYHHNEKDEWLRYGAAVYLRKCNGVTVKNCKVTGGQNALMMMECNNGTISGNDFSFNSGIGLGMYRCSGNRVLYNRINFNVRGYSHGVYNRGQDSAGILVYEQSNDNLFYKNSVTHGGDGFFLWAGQTTMDNGKGGCNGNILVGNDFSYAPTNGIELTFSQNRVSGNRIVECDHGIWGGYSYGTLINDNTFLNNRIGIAIEHGQHNRVWYNIFSGEKEAIRLWSRKEQPAGWGYAKYHDTRSVDYIIAGNSFNNHGVAMNLAGTDSLGIFGNTYSQCKKIFSLDSFVYHLDTLGGQLLDFTADQFNFPKSLFDPFKGNGKRAGRKNILITEWGPYDYRYPLLWNSNPTDTSTILKFDLWGPKGQWEVKSSRGVSNISASRGIFPASITAERTGKERTDVSIELEYVGAEMVTPFGEKVMAGKPYRFFFKKFFQPVNWDVSFYALDTAAYNPLYSETLFPASGGKQPFKTLKTDKLDFAWWGGINEAGVQYPAFVTLATGRAGFLPGKYEISITWDDAVRLYIDGKRVISEWDPSRYDFDESPHKKISLQLGGDHEFRVEHIELGGFATLSLKIRPVE